MVIYDQKSALFLQRQEACEESEIYPALITTSDWED